MSYKMAQQFAGVGVLQCNFAKSYQLRSRKDANSEAVCSMLVCHSSVSRLFKRQVTYNLAHSLPERALAPGQQIMCQNFCTTIPNAFQRRRRQQPCGSLNQILNPRAGEGRG